MRGCAGFIACVVLFGASSVARAEGDQPGQGQPPPTDPFAGGGQPPPQPVEQPQPVQEQPVEEELVHDNQGRGREWGAHLVVPIFVTVEGDLTPGIGIQGRFGWEFPSGFILEGQIGYMMNWVSDTSAEDSMYSIYGGVGARYAFYNPSALVPFIGANVTLNYWSMDTTSGVNPFPSCPDCEVSGITVSFGGGAGVAYEISAQIAIEAGVNVMATIPGSVFPDVEVFVLPFIGATFYI
jgi:hypothetical protein